MFGAQEAGQQGTANQGARPCTGRYRESKQEQGKRPQLRNEPRGAQGACFDSFRETDGSCSLRSFGHEPRRKSRVCQPGIYSPLRLRQRGSARSCDLVREVIPRSVLPKPHGALLSGGYDDLPQDPVFTSPGHVDLYHRRSKPALRSPCPGAAHGGASCRLRRT